MHELCACGVTRRRALAFSIGAGLSCGASQLASATAGTLPHQVAGVSIPQSQIALRAAALSQSVCPDFLFNHCMRTYLFGALVLQKHNISYNADQAFVAAALHDVGLLQRYESQNGSFEIDGANNAESFARDNGFDAMSADVVWHAVAMHDTRFARRQGPEARLVAAGAGSDVDGPGPDITPAQIAEIVAAFPRLQFKQRFTALLVDHCRRKPLSQSGTWLEGLCREQAPQAWTDTVEQEIAQSPFAE